MLIGRLQDGTRVYVDVQLEPVNFRRPMETVTHDHVSSGYRLSITGHTIEKHGRRWSSAGQILNEVKRLPGQEKLVEIWERWHMNDTRAACAHQTVELDGLGLPVSTPACPITGYKYGHSWLYEPLPADIIAWAQEFNKGE